MIDIQHVKKKGMLYVKITAVTALISLSLVIACKTPGTRGDSAEHLNAYCVRECVAETGDSEICDTRCKCAVEKLASMLSAKDLSELADGVEPEGKGGSEELSKLRNAFQACKAEN